MASDASHMLEAALEQMDDIIAGSKAAAELSNGGFELGSPGYASPRQVLQLAEDLRAALEAQVCPEDRDALRSQVPAATAQTLMAWLERGSVNLRTPASNETYQERLARLEGDKESLVLQVSVLTDQVEAQGEKIRDLESSLDEHLHKLNSTEGMLQQELLSRTSLETQKLDLMDEVSYLKLKLVGMEEEQDEGESRQHKAEGLLQELRVLKTKVDELEGEKSQYERKLKATKSEISELQQLLSVKDAEIESLHSQLLSRGPASNEIAEREEAHRRRLKEKHQELQRLKMGMETLLVANDEKDRRIEELTVLLGQYRKIKDVMALAQGSGDRMLSGSSEEELSGSLKMRALAHKAHSQILRSEVSSRGSSPLLVSPSSIPQELSSCSSVQMSPDLAVSPGNAGFQNGQWTQPRMLSNSLEELQSGSLQKYVVGKPVEPVVSAENRHVEHNKYQTLPGKLFRSGENGESFSPPAQKSPDESEEGEFSLRKAEKPDDATSSDLSPVSSGVDSGQQSPVSPDSKKSHKGIKKFWGKIRRTQSGGLHGEREDSEPTEFRRGGLRATAGPRLARTSDSASAARDRNTPFSKWSSEQVCTWLEDYGLGQYVNLARHWVSDGQTLLSATPQDLEKEMGIKHPLHRKKLQLALRSFTSKVKESSSELDHIWVTRWLDDIGLPQYKDQFNEGRIDGRMLQYLTVNDLLFLKVTSQLHHLSIKCAIHVLHVSKFNPHCLKRRPGDEHKTSPSEVVQWSNHRVMEWLRSVDLAEYAPNLRGSGVHGGLIILEPRFNSDTMAMLLNIPPQKTLLRRHLATNFSTLVGPQAQQEKREYMESPGYAPLTTTAKVRPKKLGFTNFGHLRKKKGDDSADYVCPMDPAPPAANGAHRPYSGFRGLSPIFDRDTERQEQMDKCIMEQEYPIMHHVGAHLKVAVTGGTLQIEALSEGINNLTVSGQDCGASRAPPNKAKPKNRLVLYIRETTL
ncbi:liprin-beta-2b isoform X7 [Anguilla rostrata]|uniref:liprin-beta-2b isoform X7 n=1 Tax=Anguilla rostrata TaxID=7938 RepID=UPI0030D62C75